MKRTKLKKQTCESRDWDWVSVSETQSRLSPDWFSVQTQSRLNFSPDWVLKIFSPDSVPTQSLLSPSQSLLSPADFLDNRTSDWALLYVKLFVLIRWTIWYQYNGQHLLFTWWNTKNRYLFFKILGFWVPLSPADFLYNRTSDRAHLYVKLFVLIRRTIRYQYNRQHPLFTWWNTKNRWIEKQVNLFKKLGFKFLNFRFI